jgi:hypothetical protein
MVFQDGTGQRCIYADSIADVFFVVVVVHSKTSVDAVVDRVRNDTNHIILVVILVAEHFESCGGVIRSRDHVGGHGARGAANIYEGDRRCSRGRVD